MKLCNCKTFTGSLLCAIGNWIKTYSCDWYTSGVFYIKIIAANEEQAYPSLQEFEKETVQLQRIYK
jgi:hypothetical protein